MRSPVERVLVMPRAASGRTAEIIVLGSPDRVGIVLARIMGAVRPWPGFVLWDWLAPAIGFFVQLDRNADNSDVVGEVMDCLRKNGIAITWQSTSPIAVGTIAD